MTKKIFAVLMIATLILPLVACSNNTKKDSETNNDQINVDESLLSVELTIPPDFVGETTQEELNQNAQEEGFKSITLNADGSATYIMSKKKHKEMMVEMKKGIDEGLNELIGSEEYPNFTNVTANKDYTSFTITTTSAELDFAESFSVMLFYTQGGLYNAFNGTPADNIHVEFVNATSGQIISSFNSADLEE